MKAESRRQNLVVNQQSIQNLQEQISNSDIKHLAEIKKLRLEIAVLKDQNKQLEDRNQVSYKLNSFKVGHSRSVSYIADATCCCHY